MPQPQSIRGVLQHVLKDLGIEKKLAEERALLVWTDVVGKEVAARTHARSISHGLLLVEVAGSVWMNELVFLKPRILDKLRERLGPGVVRDIRFRLQTGHSESDADSR